MTKIRTKAKYICMTFLLALLLAAVALMALPKQSQAQTFDQAQLLGYQAQLFVKGGPNCPEGTERVRSATGDVFCIIRSTYGPLPQACPAGFAPVVLVRPQGGFAFACALLAPLPTLAQTYQ